MSTLRCLFGLGESLYSKLACAQTHGFHRDQKEIDDAEFKMFYKSFFKDFNADPIAWQHFTGDSGDGVSFKALLFLPGQL